MAPRARPRSRPLVVIAAADETLDGIEARLERAGARAQRIRTVESRPVDPSHWLRSLRRSPAPDAVVVTSRAGVEAGVRPWRRALGTRAGRVEYWSIGPRTEVALRRAGIRRVRRPRSPSSAGLVQSLGPQPPRRVLHFRSDRAGPALANQLRRRGHRVVERVVYRVRSARRLSADDRRSLRSADLLVVTSPSGLDSLRKRTGRVGFVRLAGSVPLVVLGDRSRRRATELGFRTVSVVAPTDLQRFTGRVLRELRHAVA